MSTPWRALNAAQDGAIATRLRELLAKVDAAVLRSYGLSGAMEQSLLSRFSEWERVGVPFEQTRFLPESLEGKLHYADFVDNETDWPKTNRRRGKLIDKEIAGTLSAAERTEFDGLQSYADYYLERVAPRPMEALTHLEDLVLAKTHRKKGV